MALPRFTRRPSDRRMMRLPSGNSISSTCGFTLCHLKLLQRARPEFRESKWPMLQTMARSFIARMWSMRDDVDIAGGGDEDVGARRGIFHGDDFIAFHRRLQRADGIDFRHHHAAAGLAQRGGRAFADIAEARDHRDLAGHHHVGAAADAVHQLFAAAIEIVEFRLGDAVVHVDGGEQQLAVLLHLIEAMHAGGGFFRHALDAWRRASANQPGFSFKRALDQRRRRLPLPRCSGLSRKAVSPFSARRPVMHQHGGVAAVVQDHVGQCRRRPIRRSCGCSPNSPSGSRP